MRIDRLGMGLTLVLLSACAAHVRGSTVSSPVNPAAAHAGEASPPPVRRPPPIVTRHCAGLSPEDLKEASEYLFALSRVEPRYAKDPSGGMQQRETSKSPSLLIGVELYLPAERGLNRAYLERLLSCHAVLPPSPTSHPNDPLLAPGITAVDVDEVDGGAYRILIEAEGRAAGESLLQRARALRRTEGSVHVEQVDTSAP